MANDREIEERERHHHISGPQEQLHAGCEVRLDDECELRLLERSVL
jgi:hypothetical protein